MPFRLRNLLTVLAITLFAEATQLTQDNWAVSTKGKTIFVKFYSKVCPYCQEIVPVWDKLTDSWKNDETRMIGQVDCDVEKSLCEDHEVMGLPTILYGDPYDLKEYSSEKDFKTLNNFVEKELHPLCSPNNVAACSAEDKKRIDMWMTLPIDSVENMIYTQIQHLENAKSIFEQEMAKLQNSYDNMNQSHVLKVARIKRDVKLIESVKKMMRKGAN